MSEFNAFLRGFTWMARRIIWMFLGIAMCAYIGVSFVFVFFVPPLGMVMLITFGFLLVFFDLRYRIFKGN